MTAPAFPHPEPRDPRFSATEPGLTKREYAAIHIAAAMAARGLVFVSERNDAAMAVALADAVLREAGE